MLQPLVMEEKVAAMWLYRFLARAFSYPDASFTDTITQNGFWEELEEAADGVGIAAIKVIDKMRLYSHQSSKVVGQLLRELQIEHTYLFINAVPTVPAPPYESVYTGTGLLMGQAVSEVLAAYRESGLVMNIDHDSLPDHISVELEYVAYLIEKDIESSNNEESQESASWQEKKEMFLKHHLLIWPYKFLDVVNKNARLSFFHHLSTLTRMVLDSERSKISVK
ncbi:molecular chaperone [Chloroflexota bacterium]